MSLFYRPTGPWPAAQELWCRCDLCHKSGPWADFDFLDKDMTETLEICQDCANSRDVDWLSLYRAGWCWPER